MRRKNDKNTEFDHFQELSNEWWNPNGKFKVLHALTPLRMKYLIDNINLTSKNKPKNNNLGTVSYIDKTGIKHIGYINKNEKYVISS